MNTGTAPTVGRRPGRQVTDTVKSKADGRSKQRPGLGEQRRIIQAAAVALFTEQGSAAVGVAAICARADVSRHTFYRCFADKDALLAAIYDTAVNDHIQSAIDRLQAGQDEDTALDAVIGRVIDAILERPQLALLVFSEAGIPGSKAQAITDAAYQRAASALQRWYRETLGCAPEQALLKAVMAAAQWLVQDAIRSGANPEAATGAKRATLRLFEGIYLATRRAGDSTRPTDAPRDFGGDGRHGRG